jgi:hypothetical protein
MSESLSTWASNGFKLQPFGKGRNAIQSKHANDLVDALNMLGKIQVVRGDKDAVLYAENGVIIQLSGSDSGSGSAGSRSCIMVKSVAAEYIVGRTWDGTSEGATDVYVAKPFNARQPASEVIAGTTHTYTYSAGPDALNDYRESDDGSTTENQIVTPYWLVDGLIHVAAISYSGVSDPDDQDIKLIEVSARCWAKVAA